MNKKRKGPVLSTITISTVIRSNYWIEKSPRKYKEKSKLSMNRRNSNGCSRNW